MQDKVEGLDLFEPADDRVDSAQYSSLRVVRLDDLEAPFSLSSPERDPYLRRFATLFIDDAHTREGSTGAVHYATNAFGERFALKAYKSAYDEARFAREYEALRLVSGIKGYPYLYGKAAIDDAPVLIMEWIEGEDLLRASDRLVIDDEGRLSPLDVARLGRDLFDVLARTSVLDRAVVHGDLSLRNIMVDTLFQSIDAQASEGAFDLRIIDMSSARVDSGAAKDGQNNAQDAEVGIAATPEFAAPELREGKSATSVSDVYAAAKILSRLLYGAEASASTTVHEAEGDIAAVLVREPEVAVAVGREAADLIPAPTVEQVSAALELADESLSELLSACLECDPKKRPSASAMCTALDSFCVSYAANIGRALRGEELEPCNAPFVNKGADRLSLRARNTIRMVGKSVSYGLMTAIAIITAIMIPACDVSAGWDGAYIEGAAAECLMVLLLLPLLLGIAARGKQRSTTQGFVRGSIGIAGGAVLAFVLVATAMFTPVAFGQLMASGIFAAAVMVWCPFVLDRAFPTVSARARRKRKALPASSGSPFAPSSSRRGASRFLPGSKKLATLQMDSTEPKDSAIQENDLKERTIDHGQE